MPSRQSQGYLVEHMCAVFDDGLQLKSMERYDHGSANSCILHLAWPCWKQHLAMQCLHDVWHIHAHSTDQPLWRGAHEVMGWSV